jgi:hypothetical protein
MQKAFADMPHVTGGGLPVRTGGSKVLKGSLVAISVGIGLVGMAVSFFPIVGQAINVPLMGIAHVVDRFKNGTEASDELKFRAEYYSAQIFKQLNVRPDAQRKATVAEFKRAAAVNPALAKLYKAPLEKKAKENRESLLTNGGIALAGAFIPGGGAVAGVAEIGKTGLEVGHAAKLVVGTVKAAKAMLPTVAGGLAGGALAKVLSANNIDPQELIEAMHKTVVAAKEQGIDPSQVIEPNLVFLLRSLQDPQLSENIKQTFGHGKKSFHQMTDEEQTKVMLAYPALANAATSEAYAVAHDMFAVQELGASKPNLNATANQYAVGTRNSSFVNRLNAQRATGPAAGITA